MPEVSDERMIAIEGGRLFVRDEGAGIPVVLIPPFACDTRAFAGQRQPLLDAGYRAISYDPRGYGRSTLPAAGSPYSHARDLAALLDAIGVESAHLIGVSNGGRIAIDAALDIAARVRSLTVIGPAITGYPTPRVGALFGELQGIAASEGTGAARLGLKRLGFFTPAYEQPHLAALFDRMLADYSCYHLTAADPEIVAAPPASERMREIEVPTLIMIGEREMPEYREAATTLAGRIAGSRLIEVPRAGHFANLEAPRIVNDALIGFLESASR